MWCIFFSEGGWLARLRIISTFSSFNSIDSRPSNFIVGTLKPTNTLATPVKLLSGESSMPVEVHNVSKL